VVLIDGPTGVRFSARPRFALTFSFHHIRLTGALIYIKPRRLDFLSYSSSSRAAATPLSSRAAAAPLSHRSRAARGRAAATTPQPRLRHDPVAAPPPQPPLHHHSSHRRASPLLTPPLLCAVATIHSRTIRRSIRWLVPSLNPTCHGSRQEEGQGARG
jgi:hypothetical protein